MELSYMMNLNSGAAIPQTLQELERAVQQYKSSDLTGLDLYRRWQAIREAALALKLPDLQGDQVSGEDSY
jgi:hypothetical protein